VTLPVNAFDVEEEQKEIEETTGALGISFIVTVSFERELSQPEVVFF
jgi:hypothetical protein